MGCLNRNSCRQSSCCPKSAIKIQEYTQKPTELVSGNISNICPGVPTDIRTKQMSLKSDAKLTYHCIPITLSKLVCCEQSLFL
jgi:hypothetical protein